MESNGKSDSRGALIVLEGLDRSGKTSQSARLLSYLNGLGHPVESWCKAPEVGLLAPDLVMYLNIPPEKAAERGGYGGERYEQLEFKKNVAKYYEMLSDPSWKMIDACLPMEDVEKQMKEIVLDCVTSCQKGKPFSQLLLS